MTVALLTLGVLLLGASSGSGATLHVNNSGSPPCSDETSKARNSAATPWCTIGRAAWGATARNFPDPSEAAAAGDAVVISTGTYIHAGACPDRNNCRFSVLYNPINEGAGPNARISFAAVGTVTVRGAWWNGPVIGCNNRDHVVWSGPFYIDEANIDIAPDTGPTFMGNGSTGCGFDGVEIDGDGIPDYDDNHNGVRFEGCTACFVRNATIYDVRHPSGNHNGSGIMLYNSYDTLIEHNHIYSVDNAIFVKGDTTGITPQSGTTIRRNVLHDCAECLTIQDSRDARIYQNVIRDGRIGINLLARTPDPLEHPVGDWVINNTVNNMTGACLFMPGLWHRGVRVWNNILANCRIGFYREGGLFQDERFIDVEHNSYFQLGAFADDSASGVYTFTSWKSVTGHDLASPASISADPGLAHAGEHDFRLCTGLRVPHNLCSRASPALSIGVDVLDLNGDGSTSDNVAAGAFVSGADCIGRQHACTSGAKQRPRPIPTKPHPTRQ